MRLTLNSLQITSNETSRFRLCDLHFLTDGGIETKGQHPRRIRMLEYTMSSHRRPTWTNEVLIEIEVKALASSMFDFP